MITNTAERDLIARIMSEHTGRVVIKQGSIDSRPVVTRILARPGMTYMIVDSIKDDWTGYYRANVLQHEEIA